MVGASSIEIQIRVNFLLINHPVFNVSGYINQQWFPVGLLSKLE